MSIGVIKTPFLLSATGADFQMAPDYYTLKTSGGPTVGSGNVGPSLFMEDSSGLFVRADGDTTKAALAGMTGPGTSVLDAKYKETVGGIVANNTLGYARLYPRTLISGNLVVLGEDATTPALSIDQVAATNGWTIGTTRLYIPIINGTDIVTRVGTTTNMTLVQQADSSGLTATQNDLWLELLYEYQPANPFPSTIQSTDYRPRNWVFRIKLD